MEPEAIMPGFFESRYRFAQEMVSEGRRALERMREDLAIAALDDDGSLREFSETMRQKRGSRRRAA